MNINGKNGLACLRGMDEAAETGGTIAIYPLPHMPVIKDLVTDMTEFFEHHKSVRPWLEISPEKMAQKTELLQSKDDRKKLDGLYECILCACCSTSCPSYWWSLDGNGQYLGPAVLFRRFAGSPTRATSAAPSASPSSPSTTTSCTSATPFSTAPPHAPSTSIRVWPFNA
jgi:succinate dehydrogenase / fumarate reductase iron-sulfur subunit